MAVIGNTLESDKTCRITERANLIKMLTIPREILKKIKAREFISFDSLLTKTARNPKQNMGKVAYNIQVNSKKGISVKADELSKLLVMDLTSYMKVCDTFLSATLIYHPDLHGQLLGYQKLIVELAGQYKSQAWLAYDWEHRRACALYILRQWDICNKEDSFKYLRETAILPICFSCQHVGHLRSNCPDVENSQQLKPATQNYAKNFTQATPATILLFLNPRAMHISQVIPRQLVLVRPFEARGHTVPQPQQSLWGPDFVPCTTSLGTVQHHAQQHRTHVTEPTVVKNIQANSAQNSQETNKFFERLFVPLPNRIETPVNVKNLENLLIDYPFPHLANYLTSGLRQGFHLGYDIQGHAFK